jgi:integrase
VPAIGARPLQQLQATEIDKLYAGLEGKIAPRTAHHVHVVFDASLATAHRKKLIASNPMLHVEQVPNAETVDPEEMEPSEDDIGEGLDEAELAQVIAGFKPSASMFAPVAVDAATGLRRNELLALRVTDFNEEKKTLKIERALE